MKVAKFIRLIVLGILATAAFAFGEEPVRTWTSWGKTYEGSYTRHSANDPQTVLITLKDSGKLFGINLRGASDADREYVQSLEAKAQGAAPAEAK